MKKSPNADSYSDFGPFPEKRGPPDPLLVDSGSRFPSYLRWVEHHTGSLGTFVLDSEGLVLVSQEESPGYRGHRLIFDQSLEAVAEKPGYAPRGLC